ncbi:MAG: STAS domain-containing protein [Candidatus Acidiferrales bacterium]
MTSGRNSPINAALTKNRADRILTAAKMLASCVGTVIECTAMEVEPFRVITQPGTRDGLQVLTLRGALTSTSAPVFTEAVIGVAAPRLILDLTGVPMVDSVAIGALVRAFVSCHKSGRKLALVGMNHRVQNVLHITGIAPLFDSYETLAQAEEAFG